MDQIHGTWDKSHCAVFFYRGENTGLQILLSYSQAGPGRKAKQGQEEISHNHVQTSFLGSVHSVPVVWSSDIWSFRIFGQFLGGPNFPEYSKIDHIYIQNLI